MKSFHYLYNGTSDNKAFKEIFEHLQFVRKCVWYDEEV